MGGPIEKFIEPLGEKLLARLFPIFKDRNEIKIGMNHFLTHVWITLSISMLGFEWLAIASFALIPIAEFQDVIAGRYIDVWTRSAGWLWGVVPSVIAILK